MGRLKIGDRYSEKNDVTLFLGECLTLLRQIPDGSAQLIVTSPPYNVGKAYEQKQSLADYIEFQRKVIAECVRITRRGGSLCWQVGNHINGHQQLVPLDILLHPHFAEYESSDDIRLRNRIVWHFEHGLNCKRRFSGRHETILWYSKGEPYTFNLNAIRVPQKYPGKKAYKGPKKGTFSSHPLGKNPGDVWIFPNVKNNHVEKTIHPCQFPVELAERLILALTDTDDLVVDPFIGVGTTAVAAVLHGRQAAGADTFRKYLDVAKARVQQAACGRLPHRSLLQPVYVPPPNTSLTVSPFGAVEIDRRSLIL